MGCSFITKIPTRKFGVWGAQNIKPEAMVGKAAEHCAVEVA